MQSSTLADQLYESFPTAIVFPWDNLALCIALSQPGIMAPSKPMLSPFLKTPLTNLRNKCLSFTIQQPKT